jgi:phenylacetate-coenzyme A ligase PaaK-like adenylate-forming protein
MFDLTGRPLNAKAYDDRPFTFLDEPAHNDLANINAIDLIENGDRTARENWQNRRLTHLLRHAQARSAFWRNRLPSRTLNYGMMKYVPVQSRQDIAAQANLEGSLMAGPGNAPVSSYASTGSTGVPVKVYVCPENGYYTTIRSLAQYFINNLSLAEDRVQIIPAISRTKLENKSLAVEAAESWAGPLSKVFRNGSARKIIHQYDDDALIEELSKSRFGYLVCANRYLDILIEKGGVELVERLGIKLWLHLSDYRDPEIVEALTAIGVRSLSNYSAGEIGPIAFECAKQQGHFHVAHTNVVVECDRQTTATFNGESLGRLLITHLHSYATPIIRYDIGDFGQLHQHCPCGHDGPTISNMFGRGKHFLRHPSGKLLPFYISTRTLLETLPFKEVRFRQDTVDTISVEIGGREKITADEEANLRRLVIAATDAAFNIDIRPVKDIDWSGNPKRLFFTSTVA